MQIINGWLDQAIEIGYDNKSMSRQGYKVTHLVIHGTAGGSSAENIAHYFANSEAQASAHLIIGQDGHVVQGISMNDASWANGVVTAGHAPWLPSGNPNLWSIAIEYVKSATDNSNELTPAQAQKGFEVIACICDTYGIPKRFADSRGGICKHADIDAINRARCPGPFPWPDLWNYLQGQSSQEEEPIMINLSDVSNFFVQASNGAWHCPSTKSTIGGAILDFYRRFGNSGLNGLTHIGLPLTSELSLGNGRVLQRFERATLGYDPVHTLDFPPQSGSVYLMHIDKGPGEDPRVTDLQGYVNDLKKQIVALQQTALASENASLKSRIAGAVEALQG